MEFEVELEEVKTIQGFYVPCDDFSVVYIGQTPVIKFNAKPREAGWYAEYEPRYSRGNNYQATLSNIQCFDTRPQGNWWGPFHCSNCADWCANFGKLPNQAWTIVHGTVEESFGETFVDCSW